MSTSDEAQVCWICQLGPEEVAASDDQTPHSSSSVYASSEPSSHNHHSQSDASTDAQRDEARSATSSREPLVHDRCLCVGVMSRAHLSCLNEWVVSRGHKTCGLCGAEYNIVTVMESDETSTTSSPSSASGSADHHVQDAAGATRLLLPTSLSGSWWVFCRYAMRWTALTTRLLWCLFSLFVLGPIVTGMVVRGVLVDLLWFPVLLRLPSLFLGSSRAPHNAPLPRFTPAPRFSLNVPMALVAKADPAQRLRASIFAVLVEPMVPFVLDRTNNSEHPAVLVLQCFLSGLFIHVVLTSLHFSLWAFVHEQSLLTTLNESFKRDLAELQRLPRPARRLARLSLSLAWWRHTSLRPVTHRVIWQTVAMLTLVLGWLPGLAMALAVACETLPGGQALVLDAVYTGPPAEEDEAGNVVNPTETLQRSRSAPLGASVPAQVRLGRRRRHTLERQRRAQYGACRTVVVVRGAKYAFAQRELVRWLHVAVCPWLVGVCVQAVTRCVVDWSLPLWGGAAVVWGAPRVCTAPAPVPAPGPGQPLAVPLLWGLCAVVPSLDVLTVCGHWVAGAAVLWCVTQLIVGPALGSVVAPRVMQDWLGLIQAHPLDVAGVDACVSAHWVRGNGRRERWCDGGGGFARACAWTVDTVVYVVPRELCRVLCRTAVCCVLVGVPSCLLWCGRRGFTAVVPASAQYASTPRLPLWTLGPAHPHDRSSSSSSGASGLAAHTAALHNHSLFGTAVSLHRTFTQWTVARHGPHETLSLWGLLLTLTSITASLTLTILMVARRWLWSSVLLLERNGLSWSEPTTPSSSLNSSSDQIAVGLGAGAWMLPGGWQTWTLLIVSTAWCVLFLDLCPTSYYLLQRTLKPLRRFGAHTLRLPSHAHSVFVPPAHATKVDRWLNKLGLKLTQSTVNSISPETLTPETITAFFCTPPHHTKYVRVVAQAANLDAVYRYVSRSKELQRRLRRTVTQLESQEKKVRLLQRSHRATTLKAQQLRAAAEVQRAQLARLRATTGVASRTAVLREAAPAAAPAGTTTTNATATAATALTGSPSTTPHGPHGEAHSFGHRRRTARRTHWLSHRWCRAVANGWRRLRLLCFLLASLCWLSVVCFGPLVCVMTVLADVVPHALLLLTLATAICGSFGNIAIAYVATLLLTCFPTFVLLFCFMHYASFLHGVVRAVTAEEEAVRETLEALSKMRRIVGPHPGHAAAVTQREDARAMREAAQSSPLRTPAQPPQPEKLTGDAAMTLPVAAVPPPLPAEEQAPGAEQPTPPHEGGGPGSDVVPDPH